MDVVENKEKILSQATVDENDPNSKSAKVQDIDDDDEVLDPMAKAKHKVQRDAKLSVISLDDLSELMPKFEELLRIRPISLLKPKPLNFGSVLKHKEEE